MITNTSTGIFAPHYISSLGQGKVTQGHSALLDISFSANGLSAGTFPLGWEAGAEFITGASNCVEYKRWDESSHAWTLNPQRPATLWIQQLYGRLSYRWLFVQAGQWERGSLMLDNRLSSGDFVYSGNCRPIPQVMAGLNGFCNIPLTQGLLQINAVISYGAMTDSRWVRHHFNYYNYHLAAGQLYTYKLVHFRTNPQWKFSAEFGAQLAAFFGGKAVYYDKGHIYRTIEYKKDFGSFINMLFPALKEAESFVQGQNLGSWDFKGRFCIDATHEMSAYFQWPFEDGSGVARRNGWDGIWGFEYRDSRPDALIKAAVAEYFDFRNQSGPLHYAPGDYNHPTLVTNLTGRDNYYNNSFYNAYANYGMAIGTPVMLSPIYNLNGYTAFACNRVNGFHAGVEGCLVHGIDYRILIGYRRGLGTYDYPYPSARTSASALAEATFSLLPYWKIGTSIAIDRGDLQGNNLGLQLSISYLISGHSFRR